MGITWHKENIERMIAALLAAHPGFSPDYGTMAVYFGQGASYDALQSQFRKYRRIADEMQGSTGQIAPSTPSRRRNATSSTPRSGRGSITKSTPTKKSSNFNKANFETPTKKGSMKKESNINDPIILDDDDDEEDVVPFIKYESNFGIDTSTTTKEEVKPEPIIQMIDMFSAAAHHEAKTQHEPPAHNENPEPKDQPQLLPTPTLGGFVMPPPNHLLFSSNDSDEDEPV